IVLPVGQRLRVAIRSHSREVLIEVFTRSIETQREAGPIEAGVERRDSCVVELNRCSVQPAFSKSAETNKRVPVRTEGSRQSERAGEIPGSGWCIDAAALIFRHEHVTIGMQSLSGKQ